MYAILEGLGTFAEAPGDVHQSSHYPDALRGLFVEEVLRLMPFTFQGSVAWKNEANQTLRDPNVTAGAGEIQKREQNSGRAQYTSGRKLLMEHMAGDGGRVWAARTGAALNV